MKKALICVAQLKFQQKEYSDTRAELEKAGIQVDVASFQTSEAIGHKGLKIVVDYAFKDVDTADYDAVILIGGEGASKEFIDNEKVKYVIKEADNNEKIVAAICISPLVLAQTRLLSKRNATVWCDEKGTQKEALENLGANYVDKPVVVDTRIVTANGPEAAKEFGKTVAKMIKTS